MSLSIEIVIMIIAGITTFIFMVGSVLFLTLTRKGKNLVTKLVFRKKYVICNLLNPNTDFVDEWLVVPRPDFYTKVGKYHYNLNPNYSKRKDKGRLIFDLDRNDAIPLYIERTNSNEEIIQQVIELETAIDNNVKEFLYKRKDNIILLIVGIGWLLTIIALIFAIYSIQSNNAQIESLKAIIESKLAYNGT